MVIAPSYIIQASIYSQVLESIFTINDQDRFCKVVIGFWWFILFSFSIKQFV